MSNFADGLKRVSAKEDPAGQKAGRSGSGTPQSGLKGDTNPTKGGGINRKTQGKKQ